MPTAKKLYTFNETIVETGVAPITGSTDEEFNAATDSFVADESNYITIAVNGVTAYLLPLYGISDGETVFAVFVATTKPMDVNDTEGSDILHYAVNDTVVFSMAGFVCEITEIGANMGEWVAANTTTDGLTIQIESPNGVKLLLTGKLGVEDIAVVPKLTEQTVTPTTETQTISAPEGYAGFKSFIVDRIPSDYVPEGYVPEGTVPEGYIKPEGELVLTENVTGMDISGKATLTTNIATHEEYEGEVIIDG